MSNLEPYIHIPEVERKSLLFNPSQIKVLTAPTKYIGFIGGGGSGKTYVGGAWCLYQMLRWPNAPGLMGAPTFGQLHKATIPRFLTVCNAAGLPLTTAHINERKNFINFFGNKLHYASMEEGDFLRGPEYGFAFIDESPYCKDKSQKALLPRVRDTRGSNQILHCGTPKGTVGYVFDRFKTRANPEKTKLLTCHTKENEHNLPKDFIEDVEEDFDAKLARQELGGEFINLDGTIVFQPFDFEKDCLELPTRVDDLLYIALDFNVDPLAGVIARNDVANQRIDILDEIYLRDSNTHKLVEYLNKQKFDKSKVWIIGDSTFDKRQTSAQNTDKQLLEEAGFRIVPFKNPYVKDRYNATNNRFYKRKIKVNLKCKNLIADLSGLCHDNNDKMLGHISSALGYLVWYLYPIKRWDTPRLNFYAQ